MHLAKSLCCFLVETAFSDIHESHSYCRSTVMSDAERMQMKLSRSHLLCVSREEGAILWPLAIREIMLRKKKS